MEARLFRAAILAGAILLLDAGLSLGASYRTQNFIVEAPTPQLAEEFGRAAETFRNELAIEWLGRELPPWREPCPINTTVGPEVGAGGATTFMFDQDAAGQPQVFGWKMSVQGSRERILDSVLPHEVTHTIFASHFRRPLPRWADEGGSTTVEHMSERAKQHAMLITFLKTSRGIPFDKMFAMREYPRDIMPLYAQGYATARFLIAQGGKREFVKFMESGFEREDWAGAVKKHYGYGDLRQLQESWLGWIRDGGSNTVSEKFAGRKSNANIVLASNATQPAAEPTAQPASSTTGAILHEAAAEPTSVAQVPRTQPAVLQTPANLDRSIASNTPATGGTTNGWYARASRGEVSRTAESRVNPTPPVTRGVTHPLPIEPARQIILEWNRPAGEAQTSAQTSVPPPAQSMRTADVPRGTVLR